MKSRRPYPSRPSSRPAIASIKALADHHAANVLPIIRKIQQASTMSLNQIAAALNARGISTPAVDGSDGEASLVLSRLCRALRPEGRVGVPSRHREIERNAPALARTRTAALCPSRSAISAAIPEEHGVALADFVVVPTGT